jgi:hypothetical protein
LRARRVRRGLLRGGIRFGPYRWTTAGRQASRVGGPAAPVFRFATRQGDVSVAATVRSRARMATAWECQPATLTVAATSGRRMRLQSLLLTRIFGDGSRGRRSVSALSSSGAFPLPMNLKIARLIINDLRILRFQGFNARILRGILTPALPVEGRGRMAARSREWGHADSTGSGLLRLRLHAAPRRESVRVVDCPLPVTHHAPRECTPG